MKSGVKVDVKELVDDEPSIDEVITSVFTIPPSYIHPEIFNTMLWSIGCTLMNLFTGVPPFFFDNAETVKERVVNKEPIVNVDRWET